MKLPKSRKVELAPNATGGERSHAETAESAEFKMTELGPIPVDWEVKRLGETCSITTGRKDVNEGCEFGQYPFFTCSKEAYRANTYSFDGEALLIAGNGDVGNMHYCNGKFEAYQRTYVLMNFTKSVDFIRQYLSAFLMQRLSKDKVGSSMPYIVLGQLAGYSIPFPPLAEQRRIAGALSDVDELISALGKLIEKKRNIKTGAMQELLGMRNAECGMRNVPRRRLSGFSGEWVEKRLGDCGLCFNGITGKAGSDFGHGEAHYITFLNVLSNVVIDTEMLDAVDIKCGENQNEVKRGDLFFNTSSETAEEVGFCAVLDEEVTSVYLNSFCFGFRLTDDNVSGKFLAYWFRATGGRALMTFLAQGSTRYNLSKDAFREACISIPPTLAEQQAIAAVLSDMDAEIAALEADQAKYERIKSGMMQELLTGKTRLKGE